MKILSLLNRHIISRLSNLRIQSKSLSFYLLSAVLSSIIGILLNPFLASNLSYTDYAIIGYFTSFNLLVLPIVSFSLLSYYSRNYFIIEEKDRQSVLNTLLISQILIGTVGLVITLIGIYIFFQTAKVGFDFYPYAILCYIPVFFNCFYNFLLVERKMQKKASSYFKISLFFVLTTALFSILLVVIIKGGATGRFWSILIPSVAFGIYSIWKLLSGLTFSKEVFKKAMSFGWPISLSAILYYFLSGVDRAFLEPLNDNLNFGLYNVAMQIISYLFVFYTAISNTFEPDIYKSIAENNKKRLFRIFSGIVLLNAIPVIIFILLVNPIVDVLTFGRYTASSRFAQILALRNIPMAFCFLISNIIIGYGYPIMELTNRLIGAIFSIIIFKILIGRYGFYGAAWGHTITFVFMSLVSLTFIVYKLYIKRVKLPRIEKIDFNGD